VKVIVKVVVKVIAIVIVSTNNTGGTTINTGGTTINTVTVTVGQSLSIGFASCFIGLFYPLMDTLLNNYHRDTQRPKYKNNILINNHMGNDWTKVLRYEQ
jgi:hypothetical protein